MKNTIAQVFEKCRREKRGALTVFVSAGCPSLEATEEFIGKAEAAGADMIELGVPFSDPMADGVVIQEASQRALENGVTLPDILAMAARLRKKVSMPFVLFSYYNVLFAHGLDEVMKSCVSAGIDAMLVVDLPYEENAEVKTVADKYGISLIPLIAPTTPVERAEKVIKNGGGFAYYVTSTGVTGVRGANALKTSAEHLDEIRKVSSLPLCAGFGISSGETAAVFKDHADGVIVGSAVVRILKDTPDHKAGIEKALVLVREISAALK